MPVSTRLLWNLLICFLSTGEIVEGTAERTGLAWVTWALALALKEMLYDSLDQPFSRFLFRRNDSGADRKKRLVRGVHVALQNAGQKPWPNPSVVQAALHRFGDRLDQGRVSFLESEASELPSKRNNLSVEGS